SGFPVDRTPPTRILVNIRTQAYLSRKDQINGSQAWNAWNVLRTLTYWWQHQWSQVFSQILATGTGCFRGPLGLFFFGTVSPRLSGNQEHRESVNFHLQTN